MESKIDFLKMGGIVPCIVQDAKTLAVLMLGFMNEAAYLKTIAENKVTFYSRRKGALWTKGETSGNVLEVMSILQDCDSDTLLIKVNPKGPVCHSGTDTCFGEKNSHWNLSFLERIIADRKVNPDADSYTSGLFEQGINKISQKVGEEAIELIIEAKSDNAELFLNESADLLFHFLVLIQAKGHSLDEVIDVLKVRNKAKK